MFWLFSNSSTSLFTVARKCITCTRSVCNGTYSSSGTVRQLTILWCQCCHLFQKNLARFNCFLVLSHVRGRIQNKIRVYFEQRQKPILTEAESLLHTTNWWLSCSRNKLLPSIEYQDRNRKTSSPRLEYLAKISFIHSTDIYYDLSCIFFSEPFGHQGKESSLSRDTRNTAYQVRSVRVIRINHAVVAIVSVTL